MDQWKTIGIGRRRLVQTAGVGIGAGLTGRPAGPPGIGRCQA